MTGFIYKAVCSITGKVYIGQTIQPLADRIARHKYDSAKTVNRPFHSAIKKYGIASFSFSIVDTASSTEDLNEKEIAWIRLCNCISPRGYNLAAGGKGSNGTKPSAETRHKLSIAHRGVPKTDEWRQKMSERVRGENHPLFGKSPSKATRLKISMGNKGKTVSSETKEKIAAARKGIPHSEERKRNISMAFTEERRSRMSKLLKKRHAARRELDIVLGSWRCAI